MWMDALVTTFPNAYNVIDQLMPPRIVLHTTLIV